MDTVVPTLKVGTDAVDLEFVSEPFVENTMRGYAALVMVKNLADQQQYRFFISASSLSKHIETMRKTNQGLFKGIKLRVKKESSDRMAPYVVEPLP